MSVIVLGASGFLGRYLCEHLKSEGEVVLALSRSEISHDSFDRQLNFPTLSDIPWLDLLQEFRPTVVYHLAANSSVQDSLRSPETDFLDVAPETSRLAISIAQSQVGTRLCFFSSAAVYGNPVALPIREADACSPISPYGASKLAIEQSLYALSCCYRTNIDILRIFSAYGAGLERQLIYDIDRKIRNAIVEGKDSIELFGTGAESRDFMHATDVARAAHHIAKIDHKGFNIFNVSTGIETTVAQVVQEYLSLFPVPISAMFNGKVRSGDPLRWRACVEKITKLKFASNVDLRDGLLGYRQWRDKNPSECRISSRLSRSN